MSSQWFYIQQWKRSTWELLLEYRTIRVSWNLDDGTIVETLPRFVEIPSDVELTDESITKYLSNTYNWPILDWNVARKQT
tara:strand:+ start:359 stop:598 length:240 start_codon:yes stop_codon:yes gene_type:complete